MENIIAIAFYSATWALLLWHIKHRSQAPTTIVSALIAIALLIHGYATYQDVVTDSGYQFGIFKMSPLFFWCVNLLVLSSSLRKPLHNLFIILLPFTVLSLSAALLFDQATSTPVKLSDAMLSHVFLSIVAFSTMIMATVQALVLAYQNHQLRHKHPLGLIRLLPPLQTMEALLFELLWVGQILLTCALVTGWLYLDNLKSQAHKIAFSLIAWVIYSILLWGRHQLGWRGNSAIRWTLAGFIFLALAYFGSKFVLELILERG